MAAKMREGDSMSQYDRDITGATSGTDLVDDFNQSMAAIHSGHHGPSRPPYATRGMIWTKQGNPDQLMFFNGTSDVVLFDLDESLAAQIGMPSGTIVMWHGAVANIPAGWRLCNGSYGTPDLRGRFVAGAGGAYQPGATGGAAEIRLSVEHLPKHNHDSGGLHTESAGDHEHTGSTGTAGAHRHRMRHFSFTDSGDKDGAATGDDSRTNTEQENLETTWDGSHAHSLNINNAGSHTHKIAGNTGNVGERAYFDIRPPYYALCYIMKV